MRNSGCVGILWIQDKLYGILRQDKVLQFYKKLYKKHNHDTVHWAGFNLNDTG